MSPESTSHVISSPRRLVAILLADIAGYSRLTGSDEEGIHARIKRHRREIVEPTIQEHFGRLIRYTGDGFLAIFDSPLEAVRCAIVVQQSMAARNLSLPKNHWIRYRIGVNLGDVIVEEDDVYGEGVNIAARLEALADPGGVYISGGVYEQVKNKLVCGYQSLGDERLKNITDPVRVYRVLPDPAAVSSAARKRRGWEVPVAAAALLASVGAVGWYLATSAHRQGTSQAIATATVPQPAAPDARTVEPAARPPAAAEPAPAAAEPAAPNTQTAVVVPPRPLPKPSDAQPAAFRDCQDCPEMQRLAGGAFRMGSGEDPSEQPVHAVQIAPYALSRMPVTVGEWKACVAAKGCDLEASGDDAQPMLNVSWYDAQQYADWLAKATGRPYRLPSEAEWEYAARGGTAGRYWWGDKVAPSMANCRGCNEPYNARQPDAPARYPANPFGLLAMTGSVEQWVADCWHPNYQGAPADGTARRMPNCRENVLRGGSWRNDASYARSASRARYDTAVRYPTHGLRVARALP